MGCSSSRRLHFPLVIAWFFDLLMTKGLLAVCMKPGTFFLDFFGRELAASPLADRAI
jgi:hypothetical protein